MQDTSRLGGPRIGRLGGPRIGRLGGPRIGRLGGPRIGRLGGSRISRLGGPRIGRLGSTRMSRLGVPHISRLRGPRIGRLGSPHISRLGALTSVGWAALALVDCSRYILSFACREMQLRFHSALDSRFIAPAALPMREVMSASMDPSAEMIEPRYVNECTNSTSSSSMFIGVVIAEEGEIVMALVFVQEIDSPILRSVMSPMAIPTSWLKT